VVGEVDDVALLDLVLCPEHVRRFGEGDEGDPALVVTIDQGCRLGGFRVWASDEVADDDRGVEPDHA